jgi:hypothetical protein
MRHRVNDKLINYITSGLLPHGEGLQPAGSHGILIRGKAIVALALAY